MPKPTEEKTSGATEDPSNARTLRPYELPGQDETHEYQPDPQSTVEYLRSIAPRKKRRWGRKLPVVLLLLMLIGAGVYWFVLREKPAPKPAPTRAPAVQEQGVAKTTKHHTSSAFSLEFDYPEDWSVNETVGSGQLILRSPRLPLKDPAGKTVQGQIVFTIRGKSQTLSEFSDGNAIAALASEKMDYAKPSSIQRGSTYISFLRYENVTNEKALSGVYVTGDNGYQAEQFVPKGDFASLDPVISITFVTCANQQCTGSGSGTPMPIATSSWQDQAISGPLKKMLASLVVN